MRLHAKKMFFERRIFYPVARNELLIKTIILITKINATNKWIINTNITTKEEDVNALFSIKYLY